MRTTNVRGRVGRWCAAVVVALGAIFAPGAATAAVADVEPGDSVQISGRSSSTPGYAGSAMYGIYEEGSSTAGVPNFWAYCLEQGVTARNPATGVVGDLGSFVGENYFATDPEAQAKVLWIIANSYPAVNLANFGTATGVAGISQDDATEATQYAIWRFTELNFDANWPFETSDSEAAYWYLVNGAHDAYDNGETPTLGDLQVTVSVTAPSGEQVADSLVGPFVVSTNQSSVQVSVDPALPLVDASGDPIDVAAVQDGDELYVDVRGSLEAGSATVTVTAQGATSGFVISVPTTDGGTPTTESHAQSMVLVALASATTDADADVSWEAIPAAEIPVIGTSLADSVDGDRVLPWNGGTAVDTVAYQNLNPGVEYTLVGELMLQSDGSPTGITGQVTFTPTQANGSVEVSFAVPEGFAGESLVAFEWLFEGSDTSGEPVAEHTDINDPAQTVTVEEAPATAGPTTDLAEEALPRTGAEVPVAAIGAAGLLLLLGALLLTGRPRANRDLPSSLA